MNQYSLTIGTSTPLQAILDGFYPYTLIRSRIQMTNFSGQNLSGRDFSNQNLSGRNLSSLNLNGSRLQNANLCGANLTQTKLRGAQLFGANLRGADLSGCDLTGANLSGCDLTGADLSGASLRNTNLADTQFDGANVGNTLCQGCVGLTEDTKRNLKNQGAIFPQDLTPQPHRRWPWWTKYVIVPISAALISSGILASIAPRKEDALTPKSPSTVQPKIPK